MNLFTGAWWQELLVQLLVAVLTTVVGMLTYEARVAGPRDRVREKQLRELRRRSDETL